MQAIVKAKNCFMKINLSINIKNDFCGAIIFLTGGNATPLLLNFAPYRLYMTPERNERLNSVLNKRQPDLTVVLENVFDPHNISAVMRTADAVGIQDIFILNNKIPPHRKWGAKSSSSAAKWLTVHQFTDAEECFAELRQRYKKIYTNGSCWLIQ